MSVRELGAGFFRHGSNALLVLLLALAAGTFARYPHRFALIAFGAGAALFFVTEYTTHRFMLHAPPQRSAFVRGLQHRLHYDHHVEPERLDLLFLPLWFAVPAIALYGAVYAAIVRDTAVALSALTGSVTALAYYEWVHFVAHVPFRPRTAFGRWMKKYHLLHHFKNERLWFGVTNPGMDVLMATYRNRDDAPRSATTRTLY